MRLELKLPIDYDFLDRMKAIEAQRKSMMFFMKLPSNMDVSQKHCVQAVVKMMKGTRDYAQRAHRVQVDILLRGDDEAFDVACFWSQAQMIRDVIVNVARFEFCNLSLCYAKTNNVPKVHVLVSWSEETMLRNDSSLVF